MKAVAFSNNDIAVVAWTFDSRIKDCLGFAVYRIDVKAGVETCLPALATFPGQDATQPRTTATDPVQKFWWKDVYAKRGGSYRYRIVPMGGTPGNLAPLPIGALTSNVVQLTPDHGVLSAYFNRGILATQATAKAIHDHASLVTMKDEVVKRIDDPSDPLRLDLAGEMIDALTLLPKQAVAEGAQLWSALYEFEDPQLLETLFALKGNAHVILSNMPGKDENDKRTKDTYEDERNQAKAIGVNVTDRMMPSGHIGHNKFTILDKDGPQVVQFGSTNWTSRALCAQSNNTIIARSPKMAQAFKAYWDHLKTDTDDADGKGAQAAALRQWDGQAQPVDLEDGSASVDLWFSPNTPHARGRDREDEAVPPDLAQVFDLIAGAQQAILFVEFEPGSPSVIDAIAKAQKANPNLFVRGTVTVAAAAEKFAVGIKGDADGDGGTDGADGQKIPEDYRVISATGIDEDDKEDLHGIWEKELNKAGFAVTHSKYVVIDPFSTNCVVIMGSHNHGYQASYNNDEDLAIIKGHRPIAEAYAANALDIYDHYAWRWWLKRDPNTWTSLKPDDSWQDSYIDANSQPTSAELKFWLAATPSSEALTPQVEPTLDRPYPAVASPEQPIKPSEATKKRIARKKTVSHATGRPVEQEHLEDAGDA
jgi:phosphatidylserine/phosphatidylglycerophosphate/cardiolipin synthase-like enzyme